MPFPVIPGTSGTTVIGGATYHTGLLLPCFLIRSQASGALPQVQASDAGGAVMLTFVALGDPYGHG